MDNNEVRAIVPGRIDKHNRATLRAVTVKRENNAGALALAYLATEEARKIHPGFRAAPSVTGVLIALPEDPPDLLFEQLWQTLTLPPEEKIILTIITTDADGATLDISTTNVPTGWRWEYMESGPGHPQDENNSPYDNDIGIPGDCHPR